MGKGDKKTKRGKIIMGSTGVSRQKKIKSTAPKANAEPKKKTTKVAVEVTEEVVKKAAPKKAAAKKVTTDEAAAPKKKAPAKTKKAEE